MSVALYLITQMFANCVVNMSELMNKRVLLAEQYWGGKINYADFAALYYLKSDRDIEIRLADLEDQIKHANKFIERITETRQQLQDYYTYRKQHE